MKFEAVTIKDIAKNLGLSTSTVSRALRDSYEISEETKQRVLQYAKEKNYRPNPIAQSLKQQRSRSIGIIVAEIANSFFSQVINGIESVAHNNGYNVFITQTHELLEKEIDSLNFLSQRGVDGCIISVSTQTKDYAHICELYKQGFPIVCFDRIVDVLETHKVAVDNFKGAYDATEHLIKNGYKRIAIVSSAEHLSISKERIGGYKQALLDNALSIKDNLIKFCPFGGLVYDEIALVMDKLMKAKAKPDAIFSTGDKITTNVLHYCKTKGIHIPHTLAVIGFSNLDLTELLSPPLSVIRQPAFQIGKISAELLINMIERKRPTTDFEHIVLPAELIVRESSQ